MTTRPPILRNSLLALPFLVLGAAALWGPRMGAEVALAGLLVIGNLAFLAWAVERTTRRIVRGEPVGLTGALLAGKMMLTLPLFALLLLAIRPLAAAIGLSVMFFGVAATAATMARAAAAEA